MALLPFKKLLLISPKADEEKVLNILSRTGSVEISTTSEITGTEAAAAANTASVDSALARLSFCFDFWKGERTKISKYIKKQAKETEKITDYVPEKVSILEKIRAGKPDVAFDEFDKVGLDADALWTVADKLESINTEESNLKTAINKNAALRDSLAAFSNVDIPFSKIKDTKRVAQFIGTMPQDNYAKADFSAFDELVKVDFGTYSRQTTVYFALPIERKTEFVDFLGTLAYAAAPFDFDLTASAKIEALLAEDKELFARMVDLTEEAVKLEDENRHDYEVLYDYLRVKREKISCGEDFRLTGSTFVLTAWVPAEAEKTVTGALNDAKVDSYFSFADPAEDEVYPTLCRNNPVVAPYESITNMYSAPSPREIDPNPFVAFFYFILFGLMVSDAAYGLMLALVGFGLYALKKPRRGEGSLLLVIGMGGISTFIWGAMFGGWFGEELIPAIMFNPLKEPLKMLILSVGLGFFQILFGMGISMVQKAKNGKPLDGIMGEGVWFILFIGLGLFATGAALVKSAVLKTIGLWVLIVGAVGVLVGGAYHKKGFKGKFIGAFSNVYSITGFLSDILSYCRLFGLGLATGVVGMVVNLIAGILRDMIPVVGYILYVVILVVGHVFNIAINTLGAYVHNSRLQYVEFFSRFYTGGGHLFKPLGSDLKYIHLGK